jgi:predicted AlkP superfamily pyrophosphatase or phosphodiesterase
MKGWNTAHTSAGRGRFSPGLAAWIGAAWALAACSGRPAGHPRLAGAVPPPVVLVSLDGFRWDYLDRGLTPTLARLAREGVRAQALVPVFPTKTFPNHYSLVTGLTPGRHGIVGNEFADPGIGGFSMTDRSAVGDARFWLGEPIWLTAERQGLRTAPYFWPGSEAPIGGRRPARWIPYDHSTPDTLRVRWVLDALALPPAHRPSLVTLYLSLVDQAGHDFGPDSPEVDSAIVRADAVVGLLVRRLARRIDSVNLVVVSDHGMAAASPERTVWLDDYLARDWLQVDALSPVLLARPRAGMDDSVRMGLEAAAHLSVYRRDALPARWGLAGTSRVAPLVAVADEGWTIAWRPFAGEPPGHSSLGNHGYDNALPSMGAIFLARGPGLRRGIVVPAFGNVHVYPLLAELLGVTPPAHEGSLDSVRTLLAASGSSAPVRRGASPPAPAAPARSSGARAPR